MRAIWQFLDAVLLAAWRLGIGWLLRPDHLRLARLSLALAAAATVGAAANVAGLNLLHHVLLGLLFTLWTAWWISLLVLFARQSQITSTAAPVMPDSAVAPLSAGALFVVPPALAPRQRLIPDGSVALPAASQRMLHA